MAKINVQDAEITIISVEERDYISLTDMANAKESESRAADIIKNWLRNRYTLEFLGTWEQINNSNFKVVEFDHFKSQEQTKVALCFQRVQHRGCLLQENNIL
jgi:hypothetical protein